jgi:hypothetical protein
MNDANKQNMLFTQNYPHQVLLWSLIFLHQGMLKDARALDHSDTNIRGN